MFINKKRLTSLLVVVVSLWLAGCSTMAKDTVMSDPYENINRKVYVFNDTLDKYALKPVAEQYVKLPSPIRTGVKNFFSNLREPSNAINNLLQGKVAESAESTFRFIFNSTFGLLGIFDVMTATGLPERNEDFGQTLAVWGVAPGPYVMLPFFGPRTLRGTTAIPAEIATNPLTYALDEDFWIEGVVTAADLVDTRSRFLQFDEALQLQLDPYAQIRNAYYNNRRDRIYDGNPPKNEEADPFDDDFEEALEEAVSQ